MSEDIHLILGGKRHVAEPKLPVRTWDEVVIPEGISELERLTYVPGVVGDIVEWIIRGANRPNRMMALGSALTTVGTLIGHRVIGPSKSATHTYILVLAPSGWGKDHPLQAGPKLLDAIGRSDLIGPQGWASAPGFVERMKQDQLMACYIDELGDQLAKINPKGGGGGVWITEMVGLLKQCYNAFDMYQSPPKVGVPSKRIDWPAVSIFGVATPEKFFGTLGPGDLESGFANRFFTLPCGHYGLPPEQVVPEDAGEVPAALVRALLALPMRIKPDPNDAKEVILDSPVGFKGGPLMPPLLRVPWGKGAGEVYLGFSREMDALTGLGKDKQRSELSRRQTENSVRIATDVAVGRRSPVVEVEDIGWAVALSRHSLETAVGGFEKYMDKYEKWPVRVENALAWIMGRPDKFESEGEWFRTLGRSARYGGDPKGIITTLINEKRIARAQRSGERGPPAIGWSAIDDDGNPLGSPNVSLRKNISRYEGLERS
jgi:hypothetical protein